MCGRHLLELLEQLLGLAAHPRIDALPAFGLELLDARVILLPCVDAHVELRVVLPRLRSPAQG